MAQSHGWLSMGGYRTPAPRPPEAAQRFRMQHLPPEDASEVLRRRIHRALPSSARLCRRLRLKTRHTLRADPARHDPRKIPQIRRHIQREAMRRNALRDMHPDRRDLLCRQRRRSRPSTRRYALHCAPSSPGTPPQVRISTSSSSRTKSTGPRCGPASPADRPADRRSGYPTSCPGP